MIKIPLIKRITELALILTMLFFYQIIFAQIPKNIKNQSEFLVAKDENGDFYTIQEAINKALNTDNENVLILIRAGVYKEKLVIPKSNHHISIIGENKENTIITFDDYSSKIDTVSNETINTFTSYTLLVESDNVSLKGVTIQNSTCNQGQAVALHVNGNHFFITDSKIIGCQDTLFTGRENSSQFYLDCYIEGTTDFIFGPATAVFKNCTIKSKKNSYITAASTPKNKPFGYVFFNCNLISDGNATKVFLGRPWRPFAKTVFIKCQLGNHIVPEGWNAWEDERFPDKSKTAFYAEYKNRGEGAKTSERVKWSNQLSKKELKKYTLKSIFQDLNNWNISK
tara:strand:- start:10347 stop:11366 length:1020 start_codon:yes stop_codon:yes gene_type:complete